MRKFTEKITARCTMTAGNAFAFMNDQRALRVGPVDIPAICDVSGLRERSAYVLLTATEVADLARRLSTPQSKITATDPYQWEGS